MQNFDNLVEYSKLYEKRTLGSWTQGFKKIQKDLNLNFFFISTFGMGIGVFFPIVDNLYKNHKLNFDLSKGDVIMLTICAISIIVNENKDVISKLTKKLKEKKLDHLLDDTITAIKSVKNIILKALLKLGNAISGNAGLLDLLAYTALLVPTMDILNKLVIENNIGVDTIEQISNILSSGDAAITVGFSIVTLIAKHLMNSLLNRLKNIIKPKKEKVTESISVIDRNISVYNIPMMNNFELDMLKKLKTPQKISELSKKNRIKVHDILEYISDFNKYGFIVQTNNKEIKLTDKAKEYLDYVDNYEREVLDAIKQKRDLNKALKSLSDNNVNKFKQTVNNLFFKKSLKSFDLKKESKKIMNFESFNS